MSPARRMADGCRWSLAIRRRALAWRVRNADNDNTPPAWAAAELLRAGFAYLVPWREDEWR